MNYISNFYSQFALQFNCEFRSFSYFKRTYNGDEIKNSRVVLILQSTNDYNGAAKSFNFLSLYNLHSNRDVNVIYGDVSSVHDICKKIYEIKNKNNKIECLWLRSHGNPYELEIGKSEVLSCNNAQNLKIGLKKLESNTVIILESCSAGKVNSEGKTTIAQKIATLAQGGVVIAPTENISSEDCNFAWNRDRIEFKFKSELSDTDTNCTARFKDVNTRSLF